MTSALARRVGLTCACALLVSACGDDDGVDSRDAGGDASAMPVVEPPAAPALPAAPDLGPCPAGWRTVAPTAPDVTATCDPWPATGVASCAEDEAHFPGTPGCVRVGTACATDGWPADLPSGTPVLHVRAGATPGGTGTRDAPFARINDALAAASAGTIIALARGTYDELVRMRGGVTLWGACTAETRIASTRASDTVGTVTVTGRDAVLRNLSLSGSGSALWLAAGASAIVEDVVVVDARWVAIALYAGTSLVARRVVVRRTATAFGFGGRALNLQDGATASFEQASFEHNHEHAIFVSGDGAELRMTDAVVRDTEPETGTNELGRAIGVQGGGHAMLERIVLERNHEFAIFVGQPGALLEISDAVIRDTRSAVPTLDNGRAISVQDGATATVSRLWVERAREIALYAGGSGTVLEATNVVIRDVGPRERDSEGGRGLQARNGARVTLTRAEVSRIGDIGLYAEGADAMLELSDVHVHDAAGSVASGLFGRGLNTQQGASSRVTRLLIERVRDAAIYASGGAHTLTDLTVRGVEPRAADGDHGRGVVAHSGAVMVIDRASIEQAHDEAIAVAHPGSMLTLRDAVVRSTHGRAFDGLEGRGLNVQEGGVVDVTRARFEDNREASVFVFGDTSRATLADVVVLATHERECARTTCTAGPAGSGVAAFGGGAISMMRFVIADNAFCGVQLGIGVQPDGTPAPRGGTIDLSDGEIRGNPIGANVQTPDFDLRRITDGITYRDNSRNLSSETLPVPDLAVDEETMPTF